MPVDLVLDDPASDVFLDEAEGIRRTIVPGGVTLLTQTDRRVHSVSVGLWLPVGSRDEAPAHAGSTHALEHLLFKGTHTRSALEIATAFDAVGGESNAMTAKEHTLYYGRVRAADLPMAIEVLADMVTSSVLDEQALEVEREVILEELAAAEDDPTDVGYETFVADVLGPHTPMGRPVGGTMETVSNLRIEDVRAHYQEHYRPESLVVTAVGDMDHEQVAALVQQSLCKGGWTLSEGVAPRRRPRAHHSHDHGPTGLDAAGSSPVSSDIGKAHSLVRPTEQHHIYVGGPGLRAGSESRHALSILMSILGGGMSSRLFQNVREKRGLAYSVYSFSTAYRDAGLFGMYAACRPSRTEQVTELMLAELEHIASHGVTAEELQRAHGQIAGGFALGLEDTSSRMGRLGSSELVLGRYHSIEEILHAITHVQVEEVAALAEKFARAISTRVEVGPASQARNSQSRHDQGDPA